MSLEGVDSNIHPYRLDRNRVDVPYWSCHVTLLQWHARYIVPSSYVDSCTSRCQIHHVTQAQLFVGLRSDYPLLNQPIHPNNNKVTDYNTWHPDRWVVNTTPEHVLLSVIKGNIETSQRYFHTYRHTQSQLIDYVSPLTVITGCGYFTRIIKLYETMCCCRPVCDVNVTQNEDHAMDYFRPRIFLLINQ